MSNYRVTRFNVIAGNAPEMGLEHSYWQQIKNQAARVLEEAQELYDCAMAEDMQGTLDVDCYLDSTTYEGTLYYVIRRVSDNKILKLKHHEGPDLSVFIPSEFK